MEGMIYYLSVSLFSSRLKSKLHLMVSLFKKISLNQRFKKISDIVFCAIKLIFEYSHIHQKLCYNLGRGHVFKIVINIDQLFCCFSGLLHLSLALERT